MDYRAALFKDGGHPFPDVSKKASEVATASGRKFTNTHTLYGHSIDVTCVSVIDDDTIVSGSSDCSLIIWDVESGRMLKKLTGHSSYVWCVAAIDQYKIVSGGKDETLKIWDVESGRLIKTINNNKGSIAPKRPWHSKAFLCVTAINHNTIISGSCDHLIKIWDTTSGEEIKRFTGHLHYVLCIAIIDTHRFVSGSSDNSIKIWDMDSGIVIQTLFGHWSDVNCIAVIDTHTIISGSQDESIKMWDIDSGYQIKTMKSSYIYCFSMIEKNILVSGGLQRIGKKEDAANVWNVDSGQSITSLSGHSGAVNCMAVIDNDTIVSGSCDQTLKIWRRYGHRGK